MGYTRFGSFGYGGLVQSFRDYGLRVSLNPEP